MDMYGGVLGRRKDIRRERYIWCKVSEEAAECSLTYPCYGSDQGLNCQLSIIDD